MFTNNEAHASAVSPTGLVGSNSCGEGQTDDAFEVDLVVESGKVLAKNQRSDVLYSSFSYYTFIDQIEFLQSELGFAAAIYPRQKLSDGTVQAVLNEIRQENGSQRLHAQGASVLQAITVDYDPPQESSGHIEAISCGGKTIHVNMSDVVGGYNYPYVLSISQLGDNGELTTLYKTNNQAQYEGVAAELELATLRPLCVDGKIVMLGLMELASFDLETKQLSKTAHNMSVLYGAADVSADASSYIIFDHIKNRLVTMTDSVASAKFINIEKTLQDSDSQISLAGVTKSSAVLVSRTFKDGASDRLVTVSLSDGKIIKESNVSKQIHAAQVVSDDRLVLQYPNGETLLWSTSDHVGPTISKSVLSGVDDIDADPLPPTLALESRFVLEGGTLWFAASSWGLIGYNIPQ
jgi:hypothetical protein